MKRKLHPRERNRRALQSMASTVPRSFKEQQLFNECIVGYLERPHIIHTPVKPPSRLTPIVRTCVLAIENLINFVKGIFK